MAAFLLAGRPGGLRVGGGFAHAKASYGLAALLLLAGSAARAATPPDTPITNAASVSFNVASVPVTVSGSVTVVTSPGTPGHIELLSYVPPSQGAPAGTVTPSSVAATQCKAGASFQPLPAPTAPGAGVLQVPGTQPLAPATMYAKGDVVFISVTDLDQNRIAGVAETVDVTVTTAAGDSELLRLTETGPSTGVFTGYISTAQGAVQPGNCLLDIAGNQKITVTYVDTSEHRASISAGALIDPLGVVFDASTGQPVDGARVTIIDTATDKPARVLGNDGVSSFPSTVVAGSTVTDAGGTRYAFEPGRYQFPRLAPGTYRLEVEPPLGYRFPSATSDQAIQQLAGGPFFLGKGSRGESFTLVPGPALEMDLPLDPGPLGDVNILKTAGKATAAVGDSIPYTLAIGNRGKDPVPSLVIADQLPPGFRFQKGSARLDGAPLVDPQVSADGRSLQFAVGTLAGEGRATLRYLAVVGPGTPLGTAENSARAAGRVTSNVAKATVLVQDELNRTRSFLVGRVSVAESCDSDPASARGLGNVRVLLQDGTPIVTDANGNWHADNLRPGTHVVQLDTTTLPQGMELRNCESNTRTAGRDFSQFVNLRGGTMWRADFRLVRKASCVAQQFARREQ
ncbi:MAG TPA: hypothetical protein VFM98_19255, partial [Ramlibacter sp.]|nr:hypothetical protein [Ramlibacter sp.]